NRSWSLYRKRTRVGPRVSPLGPGRREFSVIEFLRSSVTLRLLRAEAGSSRVSGKGPVGRKAGVPFSKCNRGRHVADCAAMTPRTAPYIVLRPLFVACSALLLVAACEKSTPEP